VAEEKTYAGVYRRLQGLIEMAASVSDPDRGTPAPEIRRWISDAHDCLRLIESLIPSALADYRKLMPRFSYQVEDGLEKQASKSAERASWTDPETGLPRDEDLWFDFRFDDLARAVGILEKRGPPANLFRQLVVTALANQKHNWRESIQGICEALDGFRVPAPKRRESGKQAPPLWVSAYGESQGRVAEAISHDITACRKRFGHRFRETFPNLS
jgi:hypothetical protein